MSLTPPPSTSTDPALTTPEPTAERREAPAEGMADAALWQRARRWMRENTFAPAWLPVELQRPSMAFALATVAQLTATLVTLLLVTAVPEFSFLGIVNMLAVALIALTWGAAPSLLAAVVGAIGLEIIVLPHIPANGLDRPVNLVEVVVFLLVCSVVALIASGAEQARRHAVDAYSDERTRAMALHEANARTDEFLSIASHELRSPLTSLKAALQLGKRRLRKMSERDDASEGLLEQIEVVQGLLTTAEQQVDRENRLVGDLLDVSRIRADKLEYHETRCDLAAIVRDTVDEQRLSWPDRTIAFDPPAEAVPIHADAFRIAQVVTNFLTNALKYSPPDASVTVWVRAEDAEARVGVRDHGPGLTEEQQAHIWDRFHRVPGIKQQSGSGAGLGLGLHISRTFIEHHGGAVGIDTAPKQGSTFWFTLPLAPSAE